MIIQGEKVKLRPLTQEDLEQVVSWSQDPTVLKYMDGDYPTNMAEATQWLQQSNADRHSKRWGIFTNNNQLIGDVELDRITWRSREAELRICIGEKSFWNQGYGTDSVQTIVQYAFEEMKLHRIYLRVFADNVRAIRCYTKAHFQKEGRVERLDQKGNRRKIYLMSIELKQYERAVKRESIPHLTA